MIDLAERRAVPVPDRDSAPYWAALAAAIELIRNTELASL